MIHRGLVAGTIAVMVWLEVRYLRQGLGSIAVLRQTPDPAFRAGWFRDKVKRQWLVHVLAPAMALTLTGLWPAAWQPDQPALAAALARKAGIDADFLALLARPELWLGVAGVLIGIELAPLLLRRSKAVGLGDANALRPASLSEMPFALILAIGAGVGEELVFRGLLPAALIAIGVPAPVAFGVLVIAFGLAHVYQGWIGVLATGLAGAVLTGVLLLSNSLLIAMAVHVVIDINGLVLRPVIGMILRRWLGRLGYSD